MLNRFSLFFAEDPFHIIQKNKSVKLLYNQLNKGLDPNTKGNRGFTLISFALVHNRPNIATLLLQYGANRILNERLHIGGYDYVIDIAFENRPHGRSLLRLLLTYGATYDHLWEQARRYGWDKTGARRQDLQWMNEAKDECYNIYRLQEVGNRLFNERQYVLAKQKFEQAAALLTKFANQEEDFQKLDASSMSLKKRMLYKTNEAYVEDYFARVTLCKEMSTECERREDVKSLETDTLLEPKKTV